MKRLLRNKVISIYLVVIVIIIKLVKKCESTNLNNNNNININKKNYSRVEFGSGFVFGSGTSAYQVEGAAFQDGRSPSIYDVYAHLGRVRGDTGDIACDGYHKYKEDVKLMADMGLEAYRFSISWSRLIPNGRGSINPKALEYYNSLINELVRYGIQPHVVLLHWDLPQVLEDEYEGWLSRNIVKDFVAYADVCFREFGDRVLHWTTFNEPNWMVFFCRNASLGSCTSTRDPYTGGHNLLLAHATTVKLYRTKYQEKQGGYIGFNFYAGWFIPETDTKEDKLATQRARDFVLGWFLNPLLYGDYPSIMKERAGKRLPSFTEQEAKLVNNSFDFLAINCYIGFKIKNRPNTIDIDQRNFITDVAVATQVLVSGGEVLQHVLDYFKQDYGNPPLYIHENGYRMNHNVSLNELNDTIRVEYLDDCIGSVLESMRNGSNVKGYFVWSLMDLFELDQGYRWGFGLYYVDFNDTNRTRYPKLSAHWYSAFLKGNDTNSSAIIQQVNKDSSVNSKLLYG